MPPFTGSAVNVIVAPLQNGFALAVIVTLTGELDVLVIVTLSVEGAHGLLLIVHLNTFAPDPNEVIAVVGFELFVIVPDPEISVHNPVPETGVFP